MYNGRWGNETNAGAVRRDLDRDSSHTSDFVASSDISKLIVYCLEFHDVDEDVKSMARHGGRWADDTTGIMRRYLKEIPSEDVSHVASSNIQNIELYG